MPEHRWKFIRSGGVDQVVIRSGADIVNLEHLDQKLWVALACPTRGLELDPRTLDLIDSDDDGRIRAPELIEATRWVREHFRDADDLLRASDTVALAAIRTSTPSGESLAAAARRILALIGKPDAESIGLADLADLDQHLARQRFNGDGIVPVDAADDERTRQVIGHILATQGGVADRSGDSGIDRARAEAYFAEIDALRAWQIDGEADPAVLPLGERTCPALAAVTAVREKVNDFFARCALAAYDPVSVQALNPAAEAYRAMAPEAIERQSESVARLPLATVRPGRALPLSEGLNPAWHDAIQRLRHGAAEPILQGALSELSELDWHRLQEALAPCEKWLSAKPAVKTAQLPMEEIARTTAEDKAAVMALLEQDEAVAAQNGRVVDLERLVRYQRDLAHLLNNFVSFAEFYSGQGAVFEAGTLYLDARSCDLTVHVADPAKHAQLAGLAKVFLAYCDCTRPGAKLKIVAAFTAGDVDFLLVGRNGLFYDRSGKDWDATITKIIENPISVRQAFFSPYKKFSRMIEEQVAKRAAASDAGSQGRLGALVSKPVAGAERAPAARPGARRIDVGTVAALGVAFGSISTVLVAIFAKFVDLGWWIPVGLLGIVLAISGPSMLIAWLKLRQRSLGPILDASGWAINGRMKINVPLGATLSKTARLPAHAERRRRDPHAEHHVGAWLLLLGALLLGALVFSWRHEWLNPWLPEELHYRTPAAEVVA